MSKPLVCVECGGAAPDLVDGAGIYPHRPDLHEKFYWRCGCGAYVGCHLDTTKPLGRPAKSETHRARQAAHRAFDPLWQKKMRREGISKHAARGAGYKWLAAQLGIDPKDCHIGHMNAEQARRVVEIVQALQG